MARSYQIIREQCHNNYIIPIRPGEKAPMWSGWKDKPLSVEQFDEMLTDYGNPNFGILLGEKSGVVDIECDSDEATAAWAEWCDGTIPVTVSWRSSRGVHYLFMWDSAFDGLGSSIHLDEIEFRLGADQRSTQSLLPPSETDGFERVWVNSFDDCPIAELSAHIVERIVREANEKKTSEAKNKSIITKVAARDEDSKSPGDDYCERANWYEVLAGYYVRLKDSGDKVHWGRIGGTGVTGTTGCVSENGRELFHNFSSNDESLVEGHSYNKFSMYAILHHAGNFGAAAQALRDQGYGTDQDDLKGSAASQLVQLASDAKLFRTDSDDAFATIQVDNHEETLRLESAAFDRWLNHRYYQRSGKVAAASASNDAIGVLCGKARYEGEVHEVFIRVGQFENDLYVDLANEDWQAIRISSNGWEVVDCPPVKFERPSGMLALPTPVKGGRIEQLKEFVNVPDDQFPLLIGALMATFRPTGPFPVLIFRGEQGCSKSTTARMIRSLVDPSALPLRSEPKEVRDLMIAASNSWLLTFDNLSKVPLWLSDSLCRLATGGGFSCRKLYSDRDEVCFSVQRPTLLTGISTPTDRSDLLDRALVIELPVIDAKGRRPESELWSAFNLVRPSILGALCDGVSAALRNLDGTVLPELPRMADFARWAVAATSEYGWEMNAFIDAYNVNRTLANDEVLDDQLAAALRELVGQHGTWSGTATTLLETLNELVSDSVKNSKAWPSVPRVLSTRLKEIAPNLRLAGINYEADRTAKSKTITLTNTKVRDTSFALAT